MPEAVLYAPGDQVWVQLGAQPVPAEVVEDRGALGASGERLLRVRWTPTDSDEALEMDVPESQVRPEGQTFEQQVRRIVEHAAGAVTNVPEAEGHFTPDFILKTPTRTIVVEAKAFPQGWNRQQLAHLVRQLADAQAHWGATEALLVVPAVDRHLLGRTDRSGISVVPLAALTDWLSAHRD